MFKIGYFSIINQVTVKTLRHYDEIGLLKPELVDEMTGYRMYSSAQLPRVQKIIALKQIGLSLADIAIVLHDESNLEKVVAQLQTKQRELTADLEKREKQLHQLCTFIASIKKEKNMSIHVVIKELPEVVVASTRKVIKHYDDLFTVAPAMGEVMKKHGVTCATPAYCFNIYHDGEYKETDVDVELCEAVVKAGPNSDGVSYKTIPAIPAAACIYHKGPYEQLGRSYAAIMKWIEENGYQVADLPRESYIDGIWNKSDSQDWLTEIQIPVNKN